MEARPKMRPRRSAWRWAGLAAAAALLGSCAVGPDFVRPTPPVAERYTRDPLPDATIAADGRAQHFSPDAALTDGWWRLFGSRPLDAAVRRAIANNPTLQAAEATLRESQDSLRAGQGVFYPHAAADLDARRQRTAPLQQGVNTPSTVFNLVTLSGSVSYVLDVFGGERRTVEVLRAQSDYQRYAGIAAYMALSANVVDTCIARAGYAAEIRATEELVALEEQQVQIAEEQVRAGTASYSAVLVARSLVAGNRAQLAPLRQKVDQAGDLLAALEGVVPSKSDLPDIELTAMTLPADLPVSLPSELVRQRPDILSAEATLHASSASIGVATAAMFPSFSLGGTYGASASRLGDLSRASGRFWSIGPSATVPLFQGGTLWFSRKVAIDAFQESQANYRQVVLVAFAQVADTLNALRHDAEALQAQVDARSAADDALKLLQANYRAGLAPFTDVLAADVLAHQASLAYLQAVAQRQQDTVALYVALGGGWWNAAGTAGAGDS